MNLDEIYNVIKKDKGKFVIVEEDKPTLVIMSFDDYKSILGESKHKEIDTSPETLSPETLSPETLSPETSSSETLSSETPSSSNESKQADPEPVEEVNEYDDEKKFEELPI
ncbi:MAG: hypothetical protein U9P88_01550 [Patescibacteria group bacterium]|nr:hypothetical protein [Patescibacteria group bacterium]